MSDNEAREYTPTMDEIREAASSWHSITWTKDEADRAIAAHMAPKLTADQLTELEAAFAEELSMGGDASMMAATVRIFLEEQR